MDGAASGASRTGQPHERLRAFQAWAYRERADDQALRGSKVGGIGGRENVGDRTFARAAGKPAQALGAVAAVAGTHRVGAQVSPSGVGQAHVARRSTRAIRLARPASRGAHYIAARSRRMAVKSGKWKRAVGK